MFREMLSFFGFTQENDLNIGLLSIRSDKKQKSPIIADFEDDSAQRWLKLIRD